MGKLIKSIGYYKKALQLIGAVAAYLFITQLGFLVIQKNLSLRSQNAIQSVLKESNLISEPYTLSQVMAGFERSRLVSCSDIKNLSLGSESSFYQSNDAGCTSGPPKSIYLAGARIEVLILATNGATWQVNFTTNNGPLFYWFLWITRILGISIILILDRWMQSRRRAREALQLQELASAEALSKLAEQVAHDIRSPLAALNIVLQKNSNPESPQSELIRSASTRIQAIADDLLNRKKTALAISKIPQTSIMHILAILSQVKQEKDLSFEARTTLNFEVSELSQKMMVSADTQELARIFSNLINNAVEALAPNVLGKIQVKIFQANDKFLAIDIADNGRGIAPDVLPKLFQRGASFGKHHSASSGSGLGLHHCKMTIDSWGGECGIESISGSGTIVKLRLRVC